MSSIEELDENREGHAPNGRLALSPRLSLHENYYMNRYLFTR